MTHSNAFDTELYLRIAPELYLKRAVVGGIERVFEINRNFRNEGADSTHSPEFAMLEAYEAYGDYTTMADLTQRLIQDAAMATSGSHVVTWADGTEFDLGGDVGAHLDVRDAFRRGGRADHRRDPAVELRQLAAPRASRSTTHSASTSRSSGSTRQGRPRPPDLRDGLPARHLAAGARAPRIPGVVEKWDLYVRGFELATGYSELIDPVVQRERFVEQALAAGGDHEAMRLDEEFLRALEFGMPPTGGMGMGIDRLLMALTGLGIRETILSPWSVSGCIE